MTPDQARQAIRDALTQIVPDADIDAVPPDADLRESFELDSLDFLNLVEGLSERSGKRIDEDEYPQLATLASTIKFLSGR
ncbi:MAG: acyl carrier protein [Streptosporangiaceae bacterium]